MKVIGISGSPRKDGTTSKLVQEILNATGLETEFISLAGKDVRPCTICLACAKDNMCKMKDYVGEIRDQLIEADAIIVGGCNIYSMLNGVTHNFLERFYQFHHDGNSPIAGKPAIAVGVGGFDGATPAGTINKLFQVTRLKPVGTITTQGAVPCYTCGIGDTCKVSNVSNCLDENGQIDLSTKPDLTKQEEVVREAQELGRKLRLILENR